MLRSACGSALGQGAQVAGAACSSRPAAARAWRCASSAARRPALPAEVAPHPGIAPASWPRSAARVAGPVPFGRGLEAPPRRAPPAHLTRATASAAAATGAAATALPSLLDLLSTHGARLTTAAQMAWAQVVRPGDVVVDATCGNGNDTTFMARLVGPRGRVHAVDLQAPAVEATRAALRSALPPGEMPDVRLAQACHSELQALVGSNVARLVAFNLGYLPGGDKSVVTEAGSTLAAVEASLEVVCPGGLVSIMAYVGHPGGMDEYEQVRELLGKLPPAHWTSSELRLLNRPTAPVLLLLWRRQDAQPTGEAAGQ